MGNAPVPNSPLVKLMAVAFSIALGAAGASSPAATAGDWAAPSHSACTALRPARWAPATGVTNPRGNLRVIGIQTRQDVASVTSYESFRTAMRCLIQDFVLPHQRPGVPTLVVFNEDIGLMTLATGARGSGVRELATSPDRAPAGDTAPVAAAQALGMLDAAYSPQIAAYQARFGPIDPRKQVLVGATDTFARAFSQTFSDIARDYGVYVVASNNQARYRASTDPADIAAFRDPEVSSGPAYVATSQRVPNTTFLWGPSIVHPHAAAGQRNLLFSNEKVPLTSLETALLALDPGPTAGAAARRNAAGYVVAGHRLGFATSLPAFAWGYRFGHRPRHFKPCADVAVSYMPCMDALGVDTVIQAEANPGRWAADGGGGYWQPLEWMGSAWRAVADPTVHFRYAVNPMLVGNLLDLPFDGQSSILARGKHGGRGRHYVGDRRLRKGDPAPAAPYTGAKPQFLALAPWVVADASRPTLRAEGGRLAPGSGDAQENDYLETAVYADLLPAHRRHR